jgi:succinoglycan biosynthesis transport protein ExoP
VEVAGYLSVARRWWWTLLVATWIAAVSGFIFASQIPPTYEARVQLLVGPYNTDTDTLRAAGQLVQTYAELVTTEPLLESAIAEAGADIPVGTLDANTRATANDTTRFLTIRVQDTDPERARDLANALGDEISQLASRGTSRPEGQLQVVDAARVPSDPIAPQVSLIVGMAAMAALLGALVLVMLVEYLSATVRTKEDLERVSGLPFLGRLDTLRKIPTSALGLVDRLPNSAAAAAYRLVAAKVAFREGDTAARSIIVVGTGADGATGQVAANLAAVVARGGRRVILVDADPAEAQVTRIFELEGRPGLADLVHGSATDVTNGLMPISRTLRVMPRGTAHAADAVDLARVSDALDEFTSDADLVVVSTGPLHLSASALIWAGAGDATIVVAVRDVSRRDDVTYAIESLRLVGVQPRGAILAERHRSLGRGLVGGARPEPMIDPIDPMPVADMATPVTPVPDAPARRDRAPRASRGQGSAGETGP